MPRLLDLEIGTGRLILRIVAGGILSVLVFFLLSYLPSNIPWIIKRFAPAEVSEAAIQILSGLVHPLLPTLGALLTVLIFLEVLFRKTKAYGPTLILAGLISALYIYFAFQGGTITLPLPKGYTMGVQVNVYFDLTFVMLLALLPALLTVVKGIVMVAKHK